MKADKTTVDALFDTLDHQRVGKVPVQHLHACLRWACRSKESHIIHCSFDETLPLAEQLRDALSVNAARVIDLFREFDDDGDGEISANEFIRALPMLGIDVTKEAAKECFDSFDVRARVNATRSLPPSPHAPCPRLRPSCGLARTLRRPCARGACAAARAQHDSSGTISFREFNRLLRPTVDSKRKKNHNGGGEVIEVLSLPALKQQIAREVSKLV